MSRWCNFKGLPQLYSKLFFEQQCALHRSHLLHFTTLCRFKRMFFSSVLLQASLGVCMFHEEGLHLCLIVRNTLEHGLPVLPVLHLQQAVDCWVQHLHISQLQYKTQRCAWEIQGHVMPNLLRCSSGCTSNIDIATFMHANDSVHTLSNTCFRNF